MKFDIVEHFSKFPYCLDYITGNVQFDIDDEMIPQNLREALKSENSEQIQQTQPSQILIFKNQTFNTTSTIELFRSSARQLRSIIKYSNSDGMINYQGVSNSEKDILSDDESDIWYPSSSCPTEDCNCSKFPSIQKPSEMSLVPSVTSIESMSVVNAASVISISSITPLRSNRGVIIHWNVPCYYGISGYKVFVDGVHVTSVYSPMRTAAFIEDVNMEVAHHFAVSVTTDAEVRDVIQQQAIFFYDPDEFSYSGISVSVSSSKHKL